MSATGRMRPSKPDIFRFYPLIACFRPIAEFHQLHLQIVKVWRSVISMVLTFWFRWVQNSTTLSRFGYWGCKKKENLGEEDKTGFAEPVIVSDRLCNDPRQSYAIRHDQ